MKILIAGAGGFIGGHLTKNLTDEGHELVCVDLKPFEDWFQIFDQNLNLSADLKDLNNCLQVTENVDYIYNMACNMGGMGFIENNKAECMLSVLINTNLLRASKVNKIKRYLFSSSACVYNQKKQDKVFVEPLKEEDAYPADAEDGYGWEKLFSERMCRHFREDFKIDTISIRYHNVYGPYGTFDGGREKAPAAICRKIAEAKLKNNKEIEVWGDGEQTRSFTYIEDCILGTKKLMRLNSSEVFNLGSSEQVSINQLIEIVEEISNYKVKKKYLLNMPKGVRGRSSDNTKIKKYLNWEPTIKLKQGLKQTYEWIYNELKSGNEQSKFTKKI